MPSCFCFLEHGEGEGAGKPDEDGLEACIQEIFGAGGGSQNSLGKVAHLAQDVCSKWWVISVLDATLLGQITSGCGEEESGVLLTGFEDM
jgi:hypothetical protein